MKIYSSLFFIFLTAFSSIASAETSEYYKSYLNEIHRPGNSLAYTACVYKGRNLFLVLELLNKSGHLLEYMDGGVTSITRLAVPAHGDVTIDEMGETDLTEDEIFKLVNKYAYYTLHGIHPKADILQVIAGSPTYACVINQTDS